MNDNQVVVYDPSQDEVMQRRREQLEARLKGEKRADFMPVLAKRYGVTEDAIDQDWTRRKEWMLDAVGVADLHSLVANTVGSFNVSQDVRRDVFNDIIRLSKEIIEQYSDSPIAQMEALPVFWATVMRLLNDIDAAEEKKANLLAKIGIIKEAPKRLEIDKKEVKIRQTVDWNKLVSGLSPEARREFFDKIHDVDFTVEDREEEVEESEKDIDV